jgi:predicted nuclease with TOPRIM domain
MLTLEQVKLLETKVARAIEYVERVNTDNALLRSKLEAYQKRIDDLEVLVVRFKEDQSRIEDGILAALDRLNQFEDALENKLNPETQDKQTGKKPAAETPAEPGKTVSPKAAEKKAEKPAAEKPAAQNGSPKIFPLVFPESEEDDIADPLESSGEKQGETGELDIF